jgi:precorrin-2/cobalt-factor-2 C20-methyltransferase
MTGRLLGVGVGPGAPDLLTLRAARLIEGARVLAYPTLAGAPSMARGIVEGLVGTPEEVAIDLPMTPARAPRTGGLRPGGGAAGGAPRPGPGRGPALRGGPDVLRLVHVPARAPRPALSPSRRSRA